MTDYNGTPLDELQWREPEAVAYHNGITAENIHLYFMYSPFCDPTSNNKVLELQLKFNEGQYPILLSRTEFETRLRGMQGLEYMIVEGPTKTEPGMNPVWVIRKQRRTKERGREDSLAVLGSYFAVGENIYQAPSVEDILTCRLLSVTDNLKSLYSTAASMQYFSPSQGYGYYPPSTKPSTKSLESLKNSRAPTPTPEPSQTQSQGQLQTGASKAAQNPDVGETNALIRSLDMSMRYSIEYMDTNPLIGEPGAFVFSSTQTRLQEQQAASKAQAAAAATKASQVSKSTNVSAAATPLAEIKTSQIRKGAKNDKEKTPTSSVPGNKLKRRKSRVGSPQEG